MEHLLFNYSNPETPTSSSSSCLSYNKHSNDIY